MSRQQATALVRGFVFPDDRGRNATALTYLVAAIPCPCPYLRTALTARAGARLAPTAASAGLTRVICVSADLVMQFRQWRTKLSPCPRPRHRGEGHRRPSPLSSEP